MRQLSPAKATLLLTVTLAKFVSAEGAEMPVWLEGRWCRESDDGLVEERWLPATGNMMLAVNQTVVGGHTTAFELLRIERAEDGSASYLAQPDGRAPTSFRATRTEPGYARFENPAHDFPQLISYRRDGDRLTATIAGPKADGGTLEIPFVFERCEP